MNKRDPKVFDAFRLNLTDGTYELLAKNPGACVRVCVRAWVDWFRFMLIAL